VGGSGDRFCNPDQSDGISSGTYSAAKLIHAKQVHRGRVRI
jgi:hypothetical protein